MICDRNKNSLPLKGMWLTGLLLENWVLVEQTWGDQHKGSCKPVLFGALGFAGYQPSSRCSEKQGTEYRAGQPALTSGVCVHIPSHLMHMYYKQLFQLIKLKNSLISLNLRLKIRIFQIVAYNDKLFGGVQIYVSRWVPEGNSMARLFTIPQQPSIHIIFWSRVYNWPEAQWLG